MGSAVPPKEVIVLLLNSLPNSYKISISISSALVIDGTPFVYVTSLILQEELRRGSLKTTLEVEAWR
eukprot:c34953_g1_i1 orf=146-346(+)